MKSPYLLRMLFAAAAFSVPAAAFAHPIPAEHSHTPTVRDHTPQPHRRDVTVRQNR
jgi:hypothetical protein